MSASSRSSPGHRHTGSPPLIGTSVRIVVVTGVVAGAWLLLSIDVVSITTDAIVVDVVCVEVARKAFDEVPGAEEAVVASGTVAVVERIFVAELLVEARLTSVVVMPVVVAKVVVVVVVVEQTASSTFGSHVYAATSVLLPTAGYPSF